MRAVRKVSLSLVVAALLAVAAAPAQAQDAEKARQLFQQGSKYYDLGQFDKAIEAWQQGYDQKPDPGFLYNIAQAYRQKQDAAKAIFFYKGYLRNSPKAHNRAEVEQKITALQKQLDSAGNGAGTATTPPPPTNPPPAGTTPPPPPGNTTAPPPPGNGTAPPPVEQQPTVVVQPPPVDYAQTPPTTVTQVAPPDATVSGSRLDLGAAIGPAFWSSGVNGTAKPSFVLTLGLGYYFGQPMSRLRFRLGGLGGYTFLAANEDGSNVNFLSLLLDPALEIRLSDSGRLYGSVDLALGLQILTGVKERSKLLAANEMLKVSGALGMFETRFGVTIGYRLMSELALFSSLSSSNSQKKEHFYADITRAEWLFGAAYRF